MDAATQAGLLNNMIGPTQGPHSPSSWLLSLWDGDPEAGGAEAAADCPGYAPVSVAAADWAEATEADPVKRTTALVQFGDATDEWARTLTHWALIHPTTGALGPTGEFDREDYLDVTAAGPGPAVRPEIFFDENTEES